METEIFKILNDYSVPGTQVPVPASPPALCRFRPRNHALHGLLHPIPPERLPDPVTFLIVLNPEYQPLHHPFHRQYNRVGNHYPHALPHCIDAADLYNFLPTGESEIRLLLLVCLPMQTNQ